MTTNIGLLIVSSSSVAGEICDPVKNRMGKPSDEFDENSLTSVPFRNYAGSKEDGGPECMNISHRISERNLFQESSEESSDQDDNGRSELPQTSDKNPHPSSVMIVSEEVVGLEEITNTPLVKPSVSSSEVKESAGNPSHEDRKPATPLETEEPCIIIPRQKVGMTTSLSKSEGSTWEGVAKVGGQALKENGRGTKFKANQQKFECKKIVSSLKKKRDDDNSKICGMEHQDAGGDKKISKNEADKSRGIKHRDNKESKKRSMEYENTEPNILPYLFRAIAAYVQSCKAINLCTFIKHLLFVSFFSSTVGSSSSDTKQLPVLVELRAAVSLLSLNCSEDYFWKYEAPNKPEEKICYGMICDDPKYKMEKNDDNSCNLTFCADNTTSGIYCNTNFDKPTMSICTEVKVVSKIEPDYVYWGTALLGAITAAVLMITNVIFGNPYVQQANGVIFAPMV